TRASDLHILLDAPAIQQRYIRRDQPGWTSNGQTLTLPGGRCIADPHSRLTLAERRGLAREDGTECVTTAHFRLSAAPDLGTFIFRSSSWGLASRWRAAGLLDALSDDAYDVPAVLSLHQAPTTPSAGRHPLSFATARLVIGS
ncbi:MAG: hypothetical protein K0S37_4529, partial [Microbacterium sp.]|nr:hypothetical protein [Microbacterium sp.]